MLSVRPRSCIYVIAVFNVRPRSCIYVIAVFNVRPRSCIYVISVLNDVRPRSCIYVIQRCVQCASQVMYLRHSALCSMCVRYHNQISYLCLPVQCCSMCVRYHNQISYLCLPVQRSMCVPIPDPRFQIYIVFSCYVQSVSQSYIDNIVRCVQCVFHIIYYNIIYLHNSTLC